MTFSIAALFCNIWFFPRISPQREPEIPGNRSPNIFRIVKANHHIKIPSGYILLILARKRIPAEIHKKFQIF
jgi:hypothetical protein